MKLNMVASCISRDIFTIYKNHSIVNYLNFCSPLVAFDEGISIDPNLLTLYKDINGASHDFINLNTYICITKTMFDHINENLQHTIFIDNAFGRFDYFLLENGNLITAYNRKFLDFLIINKAIPPIQRGIKFESFSLSEIEFRIEKFSNKLLSLYKKQNIILLECMPAKICIDIVNKKYESFDLNKYIEMRTRLSNIFNILAECLHGCSIIYSPCNMIADKNHKWGAYMLHYINDYYYYYYCCFISIINGGGKDDLLYLRDGFNTLIDNKFCNKYGEIYV